jgi:hypothetical protein
LQRLFQPHTPNRSHRPENGCSAPARAGKGLAGKGWSYTGFCNEFYQALKKAAATRVIDEYVPAFDAYAVAAGEETIRCQCADPAEDIDFDRNVDLFQAGGYNCDYSASPDVTTLQGQVTFSQGTVTVEGMIVAGE